MADVLVVALVVGFFLLAATYVSACERISRGDADAGAERSVATPGASSSQP